MTLFLASLIGDIGVAAPAGARRIMYPWGKASFPAEKMPPILLFVGLVGGAILTAGADVVAAGTPAADPVTPPGLEPWSTTML